MKQGRTRNRVAASQGAAGFSLVELMAAVAVLVVLMYTVFNMTNLIGKALRTSTARIESFQGARAAFDAITRRLSQATLNTYYDYYAKDGSEYVSRVDVAAGRAKSSSLSLSNFTPAVYGRLSELHFVCGPIQDFPGIPPSMRDMKTVPGTHAIFFQAPLGQIHPKNRDKYGGLENLLNACGFFLTFGPDPLLADTGLPGFLGKIADQDKRYRFRLVEMVQPSERFQVYSDPTNWVENAYKHLNDPEELEKNNVRVLAENVVGVYFWPKLARTEEMEVDNSTNPREIGDYITATYHFDSNRGNNALNNADYASWQTSRTNQPPQMHQLPPMVQVTLVAIDEPSAKLLARESGTGMPDLGLASLFRASNEEDYDEDLATLEQTLRDRKLKYRIFSTEVAIRAAKWSIE